MILPLRLARPLAAELLCLILGLFTPVGAVAAVVYHVEADTQSIAGTDGALFLQFNPGIAGAAPSATAVLSLLSLDGGTLEPPLILSGSVEASEPEEPFELRFSNSTAWNDAYQPVKFGQSLSFQVSFDGDFMTSTEDVGTAFWISLLTVDDQVLLPDESGTASLTFQLFAPAQIEHSLNPAFDVSVVPEPSTWVLLLVGMIGIAATCRKR
jgi:hypothetical protein